MWFDRSFNGGKKEKPGRQEVMRRGRADRTRGAETTKLQNNKINKLVKSQNSRVLSW
jgi:hypothetical protein